MPAADPQIALPIDALRAIELQLATLASVAPEQARLTAQAETS